MELELYSDDPDHQEKLSQLKQIEKETDAVLSELQQRYKELSPPKKSYHVVRH